jgi:hypothetical protein
LELLIVWVKTHGVDGVWNREATGWVKFGSQAEILFAGVADTNGGIQISDSPLA